MIILCTYAAVIHNVKWNENFLIGFHDKHKMWCVPWQVPSTFPQMLIVLNLLFGK